MDWLKNFFIPLSQVIFILILSISFLFLLIRALYKKWKVEWKFSFKYKFFKKEITKKYKEILEEIPNNINIEKLKMEMLIADIKDININELIYLYQNLKGGIKNVR